MFPTPPRSGLRTSRPRSLNRPAREEDRPKRRASCRLRCAPRPPGFQKDPLSAGPRAPRRRPCAERGKLRDGTAAQAPLWKRKRRLIRPPTDQMQPHHTMVNQRRLLSVEVIPGAYWHAGSGHNPMNSHGRGAHGAIPDRPTTGAPTEVADTDHETQNTHTMTTFDVLPSKGTDPPSVKSAGMNKCCLGKLLCRHVPRERRKEPKNFGCKLCVDTSATDTSVRLGIA